MKYCLACSAGGHFQEMQLLKEHFLSKEDYIFYYSFKSEMYLGLKEKMYLVKDPKRNPFLHLWNKICSFYVFCKEKPDVILSNGAGVAFWMVFFGWLFRKKVIYVDTFAKMKKRSLFGRVVYPFAKEFYVFWPEMAKKYGKKVKILDVSILGNKRYPVKKNARIFVTVGASHFPFDRLVKKADLLVKKYPKKKFAFQIGCSKYLPKCCKNYVRYLSYNDFASKVKNSDLIISHGGIGTYIYSLIYKKPLFVLPRKREYGEAVNNHQEEVFNREGYPNVYYFDEIYRYL